MDKTVENIVARIAQAIRPDKVILFGSRATEKPGSNSDIDLLVLYRGPKAPREVQLDIHGLFKRPDFSLDVFVLSPEDFDAQKGVANTLACEVSRRGIVCYG